MSLDKFVEEMRPEIELELQENLGRWIAGEYSGLYEMLAYHMGWEGQDSGLEAQGKRMRPIILLLSAQAGGGDWRDALPMAAAVELVHNFSLIHDDIQDESRRRRGRTTMWVKWGVPQTINAGDIMYTIAYLSLAKIQAVTSAEVAFQAMKIVSETCVALTKGQYLDLAYEEMKDLPLESYWPMIGGKTAALLSSCSELGALVAGVEMEKRLAFREFGHSIGLAFQVVDDWLGIWGDPRVTGKSAASDLTSGKKTLPILFALGQKQRFADKWSAGPVQANEVDRLTNWLIEEGAQDHTEMMVDKLTKQALKALEQAVPEENEASAALKELAEKMALRKS